MLDFLCKESYDLRDFVALITFLRSPDGCPWDQVQTHESIRRNRWLAPFAGPLLHHRLWHLNRHSAAGAFAVGLFCGLIPGPFQIAGAALASAMPPATSAVAAKPAVRRLGCELMGSPCAVDNGEGPWATLTLSMGRVTPGGLLAVFVGFPQMAGPRCGPRGLRTAEGRGYAGVSYGFVG